MSTLVPFNFDAKLPAHLQAFSADGENEFGFGGISFPVLSIKGKVFTIKRNGEETLLTEPGSTNPARTIEVVILNQGPHLAYAKTYYPEGFEEGSKAKPDCFSNDGIGPDAGATNKQASKCALCPMNAQGSGATKQNPKAKACKSSKILAVAPAGQINDPMLLRVPGGSLSNLKTFGDLISKRGLRAAGVVTEVSFNFAVAHQELTFKPKAFVSPEMAVEIQKQREADLVKVIIGEKPRTALADEETALETYVPPVEEAKPEAKPEPKPKAKAKPVEAVEPAAETDDDDLPKVPRAKVKVEGEDEPKPAKKAAPVEVETEDSIDAALDDLDFDD